jgi:hypothetical protein
MGSRYPSLVVFLKFLVKSRRDKCRSFDSPPPN